MRRVEIPPLKLCRVPQCPNELDHAAPKRGPKANMCEECRSGNSLAVRFYNESLARGGLPADMPKPKQRPSRPRRPAEALTEIEVGVLRGVAEGLSNTQIGALTWRSEETIKSHVRNMLAKFEARNRAHLVAIAFGRGLLP